MRKTIFDFFLKNVSGKSHSAKNTKEGFCWGYVTCILLQTIINIQWGTLGAFEKFQKDLTSLFYI